MMRRFLEKLKGVSVAGTGGKVFGEVADIEFDDKSWQVTGLVVHVTSSAIEPRPRHPSVTAS
jgi:sporulation protein YlmC with PRC-barrel domain